MFLLTPRLARTDDDQDTSEPAKKKKKKQKTAEGGPETAEDSVVKVRAPRIPRLFLKPDCSLLDEIRDEAQINFGSYDHRRAASGPQFPTCRGRQILYVSNRVLTRS